MPDLAPRLPCPVCLGSTMEKLTVGTGVPVEVDHCRRCGGMWLERGEVQRLRAVSGAQVRERIRWRSQPVPMRCHDCHAPLSRAADACAACGWKNHLDCPACARPMQVERYANLRLDVCHGCKGVWFDHHELAAIWSASFDHALEQRGLARHQPALGSAAPATGEVLLDSLFYAPELLFYGAAAAQHGASAAWEVFALAPELAASAPEAAASAFEAVGEASGSVFEVIVDVIGGIFG
jgi:Zn-finger nucleic acid-binding protein